MACRRLTTNRVYATSLRSYNIGVRPQGATARMPDRQRMDNLPEPPPVSAHLRVLVYKDYLRTPRRWVALCVVNNGKENSVRFYKWRRDETKAIWKVDLARFSLRDIDLSQIAADAKEFARSYRVSLDWSS